MRYVTKASIASGSDGMNENAQWGRSEQTPELVRVPLACVCRWLAAPVLAPTPALLPPPLPLPTPVLVDWKLTIVEPHDRRTTELDPRTSGTAIAKRAPRIVW